MINEIELTIFLDTEIRKEKDLLKKIEKHFNMNRLEQAQNPVVFAVLGRRYQIDSFYVSKKIENLRALNITNTKPNVTIKGTAL